MSNRSSDVATLPPEVLVKVLSKLNQQQIAAASLVCSSWRSASLSALKSLDLCLRNTAQTALLPCWLRNRAQHLQHLGLDHHPASLQVQLPLEPTAQICSLCLRRGQLGSTSSSSFKVLASSLTSLTLDAVAAGGDAILKDIAVLTNLHSLKLNTVDWGPVITVPRRRLYAEAANRMWANLQYLTTLVIQHCDFDDSMVQHISTLSSLQQLDLSANQLQKATALVPLASSLTYLNLSLNHQHYPCSTLLAQQAALQQLVSLSISGLSLTKPSQLARLTNLTYLAADELHMPQPNELLLPLPSLQSLQHLQLRGSYSLPGRHAILQDLNAALQLPQLTHLDLGWNRILPAPFHGPRELSSSPAMFTGSNITQLRVLLLDCLTNPRHMGSNDYYRKGDFLMLADKCPQLQHLDLLGRIHYGSSSEDVQPLQQLSSLTYLAVGGGGGGFLLDDDILRAVAALTSLECLIVVASSGVSDLGIMSLTKLTRLTHLDISDLDFASVSAELVQPARGNEATLRLTNKGSKQANVWSQLSKRCSNSHENLKERQKELEQELRAAKKEAALERKRTAAAERKAAAAERTAVAAQQELAALRQQLADLKSVSGCWQNH